MLPFSVDQFFDVFARYNQAIWPMHVLAYLLGFVALLLTTTRMRYANQAISIILACYWAWMGIVYHLLFFSAINPAAFGFGFLFIVQATLWVYFGVVRPRLSFQFTGNGYALVGLAIILYAMLVYPLIGSLLGHGYPRSPSFGVAPCPTTIFTFGLLLWTKARVPKWLLIIPGIWAVIGFVAARLLGVSEDTGLLLSAIMSVVLLLWRDRTRVSAGKRQRYA